MLAPGEKANILLVDDMPARLLTYEAILGSLDQNLVRAQSGEEALARLLEMEVATILLDVSMPGMDGFETAAMIRGHPRSAQTPAARLRDGRRRLRLGAGHARDPARQGPGARAALSPAPRAHAP
jgi:CheY-like chemotaxis protein